MYNQKMNATKRECLMKNSGIQLNLGNKPNLLTVFKLGSSPKMIIHACSQLSKYIGDTGFGSIAIILSK